MRVRIFKRSRVRLSGRRFFRPIHFKITEIAAVLEVTYNVTTKKQQQQQQQQQQRK